MTKAEIISEISDTTGLEKKAVADCVEAFMDVVKSSVKNGEPVFLRGFGTFSVKERAAKTARNITKGTTVRIEAHDIPTFKPCAEFKAAVRDTLKK